MRKDKIFNSILEEIANESGIDLKVVHKVVEQQFKSTKKVIENDEPIVVKLPYLGKFSTTKKWYNKVQQLKLQNKNLISVGTEIVMN